jgi:hypothetical protein
MNVKLIILLSAFLVSSVGYACPQRKPCLSPQVEGPRYLNGGIGDEEVAALNLREKEFNLKMVFADADGAYLADVEVTVRDAKGAVRFSKQNLGPIMLMQLPEGPYEVSATWVGKDKTVKKIARVDKAKQRRLVFIWR